MIEHWPFTRASSTYVYVCRSRFWGPNRIGSMELEPLSPLTRFLSLILFWKTIIYRFLYTKMVIYFLLVDWSLHVHGILLLPSSLPPYLHKHSCSSSPSHCDLEWSSSTSKFPPLWHLSGALWSHILTLIQLRIGRLCLPLLPLIIIFSAHLYIFQVVIIVFYVHLYIFKPVNLKLCTTFLCSSTFPCPNS